MSLGNKGLQLLSNGIKSARARLAAGTISSEANGTAAAPSAGNLAPTQVSSIVGGSVETPGPTCSADSLLKGTAEAEAFSYGGAGAGCSYLFP